MGARLFDCDNRGLAYLRELGGEFAQRLPEVAARLRVHESG
ncbi:type VI secretion system baseplate subunit TssF, partial [Burkholderia thailandensis]